MEDSQENDKVDENSKYQCTISMESETKTKSLDQSTHISPNKEGKDEKVTTKQGSREEFSESRTEERREENKSLTPSFESHRSPPYTHSSSDEKGRYSHDSQRRSNDRDRDSQRWSDRERDRNRDHYQDRHYRGGSYHQGYSNRWSNRGGWHYNR